MGTQRDLGRVDRARSEPEAEDLRFFERLEELRVGQGKTWREISQIVREEGMGSGEGSLTDSALRKRYARWKEAQEPSVPSSGVSESKSDEEHRELDFDRFQKSRMESSLKQFEKGAALPALSPKAIASIVASLVTLNRQLLEQIEKTQQMIERLGKMLEDQEQKTTHTEHADEQPVTAQDLLQLLREITAGGLPMKFIEENKEYDISRQEVLQLLDERVQDKVDAELRVMLSDEGSFSKELSHLIDLRLKTLFSGGEPVATTPPAGPGRGRKGRTHKKFSASLEEGLFERVRSLPGQFSRHLANALSSYISVMEDKKED